HSSFESDLLKRNYETRFFDLAVKDKSLSSSNTNTPAPAPAPFGPNGYRVGRPDFELVILPTGKWVTIHSAIMDDDTKRKTSAFNDTAPLHYSGKRWIDCIVAHAAEVHATRVKCYIEVGVPHSDTDKHNILRCLRISALLPNMKRNHGTIGQW
ncbi:MAG: hypothetical protein ACREOZ_00845, partial [Gloeomargaritales cyanobacterium]